LKKLTELLINDQKFVITSLFLKACKSLEVSLSEMYVLLFIENHPNVSFDPNKMSEILSLTKEEVLESFNSLVGKGLIEIKTGTDAGGKVSETIHVTGIKNLMEDMALAEKETHEKTDIYQHFEAEFGRTISPMEYEIIESWLTHGINEELILGALKEAIYNGVKSFRYIDKILYTWGEKGFKTMKDVKAHMKTRDNKKTPELFDYNWLEEETDDK